MWRQVHELLQQRAASSARLEVYPGCGHVPMDDCRERFEADVAGFVERVFAASPAAVSPPQRDGAASAGGWQRVKIGKGQRCNMYGVQTAPVLTLA